MMMIVFQVLKDKDDGLDGDLDIRDDIYIVQLMMIVIRRILLMIDDCRQYHLKMLQGTHIHPHRWNPSEIVKVQFEFNLIQFKTLKVVKNSKYNLEFLATFNQEFKSIEDYSDKTKDIQEFRNSQKSIVLFAPGGGLHC